MATCPRCGAAAAAYQRFCSNCGAALPAAATPPAPAAASARPDTRTAELLIQIGAIVAFVMEGFALLFSLLFLLFFDAVLARFEPFQTFPFGGGFVGFFAVLSIVGIGLGILALAARTRIHAGDVDGGGKTAVVAGAILLVTAGIIAGGLVLAGGILTLNARRAAPPAPVP